MAESKRKLPDKLSLLRQEITDVGLDIEAWCDGKDHPYDTLKNLPGGFMYKMGNKLDVDIFYQFSNPNRTLI